MRSGDYDVDKHCRPANNDGVWWALVRIHARPGATVTEVKRAIAASVLVDILDDEHNDGTLESVELMNGLTPDSGIEGDGPVVYFP